MAKGIDNSDNGNTGELVSGPVVGQPESGGIIDPVSLAGTDDFQRDEHGNLVYGVSGKPNRKRGRKSGSGSSASGSTGAKSTARNSQTVAVGLDTFSQSLMIVHMGLASFTGFDKFALEKKEADTLAASVANVMEQFDMTPDPKFTAVVGLVTTGAMIYGPRVYLYKEHKAAKDKEKKTETPPSNVSQFKGGEASGFNLAG